MKPRRDSSATPIPNRSGDGAALTQDFPPVVVCFLDHTARLSGGEIALARLLAALDRGKVKPVVVLAEDGPLAEQLRAMDVETHVLSLSANIRNIRKDSLHRSAFARIGALIHVLVYSLRIARFARQRGAQILHTNSLKSDIYGGIAGWLARIPTVWHVRDHINPNYLPSAAVNVFRFLANALPTYIITNSQSTLDELRLERETPAAVVPSGLDLRSTVVHDGLVSQELAVDRPRPIGQAEKEMRREWHRPVRIGIVGRIAEWKGQHVFLEAAASLLRKGYDAEFALVGSPMFGEESYEAQLRNQVAAAGIAERVKFMGFQKNVPDALRNLDILVHASVTPEPFGQVVIEGMAEGLPVIATDGGGVREVVRHGHNGILVPMGDASAMAEALQSLLDNPQRAREMATVGYQWVRRYFTSAQSARKVETVYRAILQRDRR